MPYAEDLLAVIAAPTSAAKAALLADMRAPQETWVVPVPPGRPGRPAHYHEAEETRRRRRTLAHAPTRLRFLQSIHHIELSAVDLAVLACLRAPDMPAAFHTDFLGIARDEARHAGLLEELLATRGAAPGDAPIHHRLWATALACDDLGDHLVAVPRFLEARGLDVSAELLPRLVGLDPEAHTVLSVIYHDEIGHVGIGTRWHRAWCQAQGRDPESHFATVLARLFPGQVPGPTPLDHAGRLAAGFTASEVGLLEGFRGDRVAREEAPAAPAALVSGHQGQRPAADHHIQPPPTIGQPPAVSRQPSASPGV
ncbi:MAG: DUF455 family protein [Planctomycetes bacterium]|nr:DUF455 family protein [Planctomycetota bacterium]